MAETQKEWRQKIKAKHPKVTFEVLLAAGEVAAWVGGKQVGWFNLDNEPSNKLSRAKDVAPVGDATPLSEYREQLLAVKREKNAEKQQEILRKAGKEYSNAELHSMIKGVNAAKDVAPVGDGMQLKVTKNCPAENHTQNRSGNIPAGATVTMLDQTDKGILVKYQGDTWHVDFYDADRCIPDPTKKAKDVQPVGDKTVPDTCTICGGRKYDNVHATKSSNPETRKKAHEFTAKAKDLAPVDDDKPNMSSLMKSEDSENKLVAPLAKVIPRSKRPAKDGASIVDPMEGDIQWGNKLQRRIKNAKLDARSRREIEEAFEMGEFEVVEDRLNRMGAKDASPFDRDTEAGAIRIIKREAAAGKTVKQIVKEYGFSEKFVTEEYPAKGKDVAPVGISNYTYEQQKAIPTPTRGATAKEVAAYGKKAKDETYRVTDSGATLLKPATDALSAKERKEWEDLYEIEVYHPTKKLTGAQRKRYDELSAKAKDVMPVGDVNPADVPDFNYEAKAEEIKKLSKSGKSVEQIAKAIGVKNLQYIRDVLGVKPVGDVGSVHIGMMGVNADKAKSLAAGLRRKGFEYRFPVEPPKAEMVRHGFVKRDPDGGKNEWKILNERKNGYHNVTDL